MLEIVSKAMAVRDFIGWSVVLPDDACFMTTHLSSRLRLAHEFVSSTRRVE